MYIIKKQNISSEIVILLKRFIFILVVILYFNLGFILIVPEVYLNFRYLLIFFLFYFIIVVNALICPIFIGGRSKDRSPRTTIFLVIFDLIAPIGIMLPYFEYTIVFQQNFSPESFEVTLMLSV